MRKLYPLFAGFVVAIMASISVNARPLTPDVANFSFTIDVPNNNVLFVNTSVLGNEPGLRNAFWSFGDGTVQMTPPLQGTQHHYSSAGTYNVCLRIYRYMTNSGDSVLSAEICKTVVIETATCQANFESPTGSPTALGKYFIAQPLHSQNKKPVRICWTFGDGRDTCIQYLTTYTGVYAVYHLYAMAGNYNVCVDILYDGGCEAQSCHNVLVGPPDSCRADFERIPVTSTTNPLTVVYKALPWHNNNKKPSRICWTFGDGRDTCINYLNIYVGQYTVPHTYSHAGLYQVCVDILYYGGCEATKCKSIQVGNPDTCHADFERLPVSGTTNPLLAYFNALPQHNNNRKPSRVCWNFGDNHDTCINYTETYTGIYAVSHRYNAPGTYQVCVNILYFGGCEASNCKPIVIARPDTCHADFVRIQPAPTSLQSYFQALPQHNNNRKPSRICWTFGDNRDTCINYTETYTGQYVVNHGYSTPGTYQVCVNILYFGGCDASNCHAIQVGRPDTCHADFERLPLSGTANPLLAYFNALPQHNNNRKPSRVCWNFGDNHDTCINYTETYTGLYTVSHRYNAPGTYQVCVNILYFGDCEASKCKPAEIARPDTCHADFVKLTTSPTSLQCYFQALPQHNNNRKPSRVCWTFGDNRDTCIYYTETYTGQYVVSHGYNVPGTYQVCVHILYFGGCEASNCHAIQVGRPDTCHADFERLPTSAGANPLLAYLNALPQHNNNRKPSQVCWNFGDNHDTCINYTETYTGQYIVRHMYNAPGTYQVCVHILYFGGCEASKCKPIEIARPDTCHADFVRIQTSPTSLQNYFQALPQHNNNRKPSRVCWTFGDNRDTCIYYTETYTGQYVVSHGYSAPGTYQVCVHILYFGGCEASNCHAIQVGRPDTCHADFERLPTSAGTNPLLAYFNALPQHNNNRKPSQICWNFGDNHDTCINYTETYTGQYIVRHMYNAPGTYQVCVHILYFGGCEASKCKPIEIARPDTCGADFVRINTSPTALQTYFQALPQHNNNRKPSRICWTFGDNRDTCINYTETFTGQYVVSHAYNAPGTYQVCVDILYFGGCEANKCHTITIPPPQTTCIANLFEITPSITSLTRGFYATASSTPPSRPDRICWHFGDGTDTCIMIDPTLPVPVFLINHTYPGPGNYTACVSVRFLGGCIAESCKEVVIIGAGNMCGGYMTDSLIAPRSYKFKAFSIHGPGDQVLSYHWTFGDGSSGTGQEITHTYSQAGNYQVCVIITTQSGCETRICRPLPVPGSNVPTLYLSPNPVINELHVDFQSTLTEQVTIRILNATGTPVRTYIRNVTVGLNTWTHDLSSLLPGVYTYILQSPNQLSSAIFLKQ